MSGPRVLITGATGGLGQALLAEAQARGWRVRASGRSALDLPDIEYRCADLAAGDCDLRALTDGCSTVIHAAALSASWGARADFEAINVAATRRLLAAARQSGAKRFVFISSPSIFASYRNRIAIGENDAPAGLPLNHYARTKLAAERLVLAADGARMATCAIRPRALVGRGDRVILPRLVALARRPRLPLPRHGQALVELTDLRDAAWATCEAAARCETLGGRAINISGGRPITVRALAQGVAEALGTSPRLVNLPAIPARIIAAMLEATARLAGSRDEPLLTRYTLATMAWSQTFDPVPAQRLLGFVPSHDATATLLAEVRRLHGNGRAA